MLILTFEEFNNKYIMYNNAMSDIRIKDIGKDISLTPIEIVMRDQTLDYTSETNFNIISFGVETPPLFFGRIC